MIVAIVNNDSVSINEYPYIESIEEVRDDFLPDTLLIELTEKPEYRDGYILKYNGTEFYYEEIPLPELTETELIQAEILLNQADILAKQNEQDEVLAAILLNQMEV